MTPLFLHGSRPNGAHTWLRFDGRFDYLRWRWLKLIECCPHDTTWVCTPVEQP